MLSRLYDLHLFSILYLFYLSIEWIRLWMLVHSSSVAVWSCWILAETRTRAIFSEHSKHAPKVIYLGKRLAR